MDTKSREFQYKILNRYLSTNSFLKKIGLTTSPLCTFCEQESESLERLFITCPYAKSFWLDFISCCKTINIDLEELSSTNILFGIWQRKEDFLLISHLIILAKQHIYECRMKRVHPSYRIFTNKVEYVYRLELRIGKLNNKESSHKRKWKKYTD